MYEIGVDPPAVDDPRQRDALVRGHAVGVHPRTRARRVLGSQADGQVPPPELTLAASCSSSWASPRSRRCRSTTLGVLAMGGVLSDYSVNTSAPRRAHLELWHQFNVAALPALPAHHAAGDVLRRHDAAAAHPRACSSAASPRARSARSTALNTLGAIVGRQCARARAHADDRPEGRHRARCARRHVARARADPRRDRERPRARMRPTAPTHQRRSAPCFAVCAGLLGAGSTRRC